MKFNLPPLHTRILRAQARFKVWIQLRQGIIDRKKPTEGLYLCRPVMLIQLEYFLEAVISIIFLLLVGLVLIFHLIHINFRPKLRAHRIFVLIVVFVLFLVGVSVIVIRHGHSPPYALSCAQDEVLIAGNFCIKVYGNQ